MIKIYLESKDSRLTEITVDEFIKSSKTFLNGKANKSEAIKLLNSAIKQIYESLDNKDKSYVYTIIAELQPAEGAVNYKTDYYIRDLLQEFIVFYSTKLNDILCQDILNPSYIKATGNYANSNINLYGVKKDQNKVAIIIKSFAFCSVPKEEELYVATTCGTGGTSILFSKLKQLVADHSFYEKEYNKIRYIHLESIENANTINFYTRLGFYKTNKDTKNILNDMIKKIYKKDMSYGEYIDQSNLDIGGSMYWSDEQKILKKLKCYYEYTPELWYKNIQNMKKQGLNQNEVLNHFYSKYEELKGAGIPDVDEPQKKRKDKTEGYDLHAVVVHKPIDVDKAFEESKKFINEERNFYRETQNSFRFRNIPKQRFEKKTFKSKKISPNITLVYGKLK